MPLFEVVILEKPTKNEAEDGKAEQLVLGIVSVVAADAQSAAISAVIDNPDDLLDVDRTRMQVIVRPFV